MERSTLLAACGLLVALPCRAAQSPAIVDEHLDAIQETIGSLRNLPDDEAAATLDRLRALAVEYLAAFAPLLGAGGPVDLAPERAGWEGPGGRQEAFERRVCADLRHWHPLFALVFVETVLHEGSRGTYALMVEARPGEAEGAIRQRKRSAVAADPGDEAAKRRTEQRIEDEIVRTWRMLSSLLGDNLAGILERSLNTHPRPDRFDVVVHVAAVAKEVFRDGPCGAIAAALRQTAGSAALSAAVLDAANGQILDTSADVASRREHFALLLRILVLLDTAAAKDALLLLHDRFADETDSTEGTFRPFEEALIAATIDFIAQDASAHVEQGLGLEVIDQLTRWMLTRVDLSSLELRGISVVRTMHMIQRARPMVLEAYITRFHRDFHALDPAGYEAVIFHLVGILVEYAGQGLYLKPDPIVKPPPQAAPLPTHELVMEVLRGYNRALGATMGSLPRINPFYIDGAQRDEVRKIFAFFLVRPSVFGRRFEREDPRLVETLLMLLQRIAHAWDPGEIRERVLVPFEEIEKLDENPLHGGGKKLMTSAMHATLDFLREIVNRRESEK